MTDPEDTCQCLVRDPPCPLHFAKSKWSLLRQCLEESLRLMEELEEFVDDCSETLEVYQVASLHQGQRPPTTEEDVTSTAMPRSGKKRARQSKKGDNYISKKQTIRTNHPLVPQPGTSAPSPEARTLVSPRDEQPFRLDPNDFPPL